MGNIISGGGLKLPSKLDLVEAAIAEYDFLRLVERFPALYATPVLLNAVYRYETYWLPLIKDHDGEYFCAPLDIEWVWHCHILNPVTYSKDCNNIVGKVIDHKPVMNLEVSQQKSKTYWERRYPGVSYSVDLNNNNPVPLVTGTFVQKSSYDIVAACQRQRGFNYNSSFPHFRDAKFLKKAFERYRTMLQIKRDNPKTFVVPCYDNDLLWHTHQLFPKTYWSDTSYMLGRVLDHDDSPEDRSPGSHLDNSSSETKRLWKGLGKKFAVPGAMYRGNPPIPKIDCVPNRFSSLSNMVS